MVVKGNTRVKSTDGPEKTIIVGAAATEEPDEYGCGTNAVRCAALKDKGAVLSGFTLTGGRTHKLGDNAGGGVIGTSSSARDFSYAEIVENCIISNNVAVTGSAAAWCQLFGCRVIGNTASNGSVVSQASVFGTFIDDNVMSGSVFYYSENVCGSTIGPNNRNAAGKAVGGFGMPGFTPNKKGRIYNSVFHVKVGVSSGAMEIRNSVFTADSAFHVTDSDTNETVVLTAAANLALNEDGTPKIGVSPAVDAADLSLYDFDFSDVGYKAPDLNYVAKTLEYVDVWCRGAKDLNGNMRVANGTADVGCFEADWKAQYAKILGGGCSVTEASSNVVATVGGSTVSLGDGGRLACILRPGAGSGATVRYLMRSQVAAGALSVSVNGDELASLDSSAGETALSFKSALSENEVVFACNAGEGASATVWGFGRAGGTVLVVR